MSFQTVLQALPGQIVYLHTDEMLVYAPNRTKQRDEDKISGETSLAALVSALIPSLLTALLMASAFLFLRRRFRRVYQPRTYLASVPKDEQTPVPRTTFFSWARDFWALPDTYALNHHSLDAYLFLRFLKVLIGLGLAGMVVTWPILLPINATGGAGFVQLDALLIGNVEDKHKFYAHAIIACLFLGFVLFVITRETMFYINLKLAIQTSPRFQSRLSSKVVLFTSVPDEMRSEAAIREALQGVTRVWIPRKCEDINEQVKDRDATAMKLEKAVVEFGRKANADHEKRSSANDAASENGPGFVSEYAKDRPSHRTQLLIGDKVDTIDWARQHLEELLPKIADLRKAYFEGKGSPRPDIFVEFESMAAAEVAFQRAFANGLSALDLRCQSMAPSDIVWENIGLGFSQRRLRQAITTTAIALIIVFWSVPVAIIGTISNINYLTEQFHFLKFINDLPQPILGVLTGLVPQLLLSSLMSFVPIICRFIANLGGDVRESGIEMTTQTWYFAFSIVQVFLVTSLSSGAASTIHQIVEEPKQAAYLLAQNLPKGSNFYASYFLLYGLANSAKTILNIFEFIMLEFVGKFLDRTPREAFQRRSNIKKLSYGSNYPKYTNLMCIAISYSCIAPLVLGFATLGVSLLYIAFRYNVFYAFGSKVDTTGHMYNRALQQLIAGVYISELCLIGLFSLRTAFGPLVITVLFFILTVLYHLTMNMALGRLTKSYPTFAIDAKSAQNSSGPRDHILDELFLRFDRRLASFIESEPIEDDNEGAPLLSRPSPPKSLSLLFNANLFRVPSFEELADKYLGTRFTDTVPSYSSEVQQNAYHPPEVSSPTPKLWVVRDSAGVSKSEVEQTREVTEITDEHAHFNEKSKIRWNEDDLGEVPIFKTAVYY